jgi:spermidine synthase
MDLAAHKNPDLSILQIGGSDTFTRSLLSLLGVDPTTTFRFSSYTIADTDSEVVTKAEQTFKKWSGRISFRLLDTDSENETFQNDSFDVILAIKAYGSAEEKASFLRDAHSWLRQGGTILVGELLQSNPTA